MNRTSFDKAKNCCTAFILALQDTVNVIHGKWKLRIIGVLLFGKRRFKDLQRDIPGITPRMLSKELKELELNGVVKRTVFDTIPVSVEYELTKSGKSLNEVLDPMIKWGLQHRKNVIGK